MRNAAVVVAVFALVGVTTRAALGDNDQTEHLNRTVSLDPGGTLRLKSFSGRVTITASDRSEVVVHATRRGDRERLHRITVVVDANHREPSSWFNRRHNVVETDFDITVPRRTNIDIDVFSAPVSVTGVEGVYKVHTFSSRVRLNEVGWQARQTIDVSTFSGDVEVQLPASATGNVSFRSFSGRLTSDLPLTLHSSRRRSVTAELGSGGDGHVRVKTFSGSARIRR